MRHILGEKVSAQALTEDMIDFHNASKRDKKNTARFGEHSPNHFGEDCGSSKETHK